MAMFFSQSMAGAAVVKLLELVPLGIYFYFVGFKAKCSCNPANDVRKNIFLTMIGLAVSIVLLEIVIGVL